MIPGVQFSFMQYKKCNILMTGTGPDVGSKHRNTAFYCTNKHLHPSVKLPFNKSC